MPHEEEVTGTFTLPGGSRYPGDAAIDAASDARCKTYFARYVGVDWDSSAYDYYYATPYPWGWRQWDHKAICLADDPNHPTDNTISLRTSRSDQAGRSYVPRRTGRRNPTLSGQRPLIAHVPVTPAFASRYPGDAAIDAASDARCKTYFARYVGVDWDSSTAHGRGDSEFSSQVRQRLHDWPTTPIPA